jgi:hypothetical protein
MDDSKIVELRTILKNLAVYLKDQHEATKNSILAVAAIRGAVASNPPLQKSYEASLRDLKDAGTIQPSPALEQTLLTLLRKLDEW